MFSVELESGPLGVHGQSAAQVVGGGLQINPTYQQAGAEEPLAWVEAASEFDAIEVGVIGSAVVDLTPVGKPITTYQYNPANVGNGAPAPYRIVAHPGNVPGAQITTWIIQLEDMAAHTGCDWDYNDHSWTVRVTNYSLPLPIGPGAISGTVWTDNTRDNQLNLANDAAKANTLVTLTTSTGGRWAETYTDANGFYAFTSLPLGNYRVRVNSWGIERFVTQAYGGNPAIDSDVNAGGHSNLIPVNVAGSAQFPSADVDAGVFLNSPHPNDYATYGPLVRIFRPGENQTADQLKVAKWSGGQHDWSRAFEASAVQNAQRNAAHLRGVEAGGLDFIDADPDRFNIFVMDRDVVGDTLDVTIRTTHTDFDYVDPPTTIRLIRVPLAAWQHWFWSDSMILVSNATDDAESRNPAAIPGEPDPNKLGGGIGADDQPFSPTVFNHKHGLDFPLSDRTHRVALGGTVKVEYAVGGQTIPAEVEVKVRKQVKVTIYVLKQTGVNGGNPVDTAPGVNPVTDDVKRMKEIYAQMGIEVVEDIKPPVDVTGIVDLMNGMTLGIGAEETALLGLPRTGAGAGGKNDIEVYYVNHFSAPDGLTRGYAVAVNDRPAPDHNFAIISVRERNWGTLAHEVGHVLDDQPFPHHHYPYDWAVFDPTDRVNLMTVGGRAPRNTPPLVNDSRRLTDRQQERWDDASDNLLWDPT